MSRGEKNLKRDAKMVNTLIAQEKDAQEYAEERARQ
jgi:hypothetical protein